MSQIVIHAEVPDNSLLRLSVRPAFNSFLQTTTKDSMYFNEKGSDGTELGFVHSYDTL